MVVRRRPKKIFEIAPFDRPKIGTPYGGPTGGFLPDLSQKPFKIVPGLFTPAKGKKKLILPK